MIPFDAHAHAGSIRELALRQRLGMHTLLSCGNVPQAAQGEALLAQYAVLHMTAGIHPWYAETQSLKDMLPYMRHAVLTGEIGLDSVWCTVPLPVQRKAFHAQLDWAAANGSGIVLHTKGCETEIAHAIEGFPNPVVVHWYSGGPDALEHFLSQNCYFTIGPDVACNPSVQAVARLVPDDRILLETDGMDAVAWALGALPTDCLPDVLTASAQTAAQLRGQTADAIIQNANGNFFRLLRR